MDRYIPEGKPWVKKEEYHGCQTWCRTRGAHASKDALSIARNDHRSLMETDHWWSLKDTSVLDGGTSLVNTGLRFLEVGYPWAGEMTTNGEIAITIRDLRGIGLVREGEGRYLPLRMYSPSCIAFSISASSLRLLFSTNHGEFVSRYRMGWQVN